MPATSKTTKEVKVQTEKIIKVKPNGHTVIKVKAAQHGMSMGDYVEQLARKDNS